MERKKGEGKIKIIRGSKEDKQQSRRGKDGTKEKEMKGEG